MKNISKKEWGDFHGSIDFNDAFELIGGKSEEEIFSLIMKSPFLVAECLCFTNEVPYKNLLVIFSRFISRYHDSYEDIHIIVDVFFREVYGNIISKNRILDDIIGEISSTFSFIVKNQERLGADIDIYGSYQVKYNEIKHAL